MSCSSPPASTSGSHRCCPRASRAAASAAATAATARECATRRSGTSFPASSSRQRASSGSPSPAARSRSGTRSSCVSASSSTPGSPTSTIADRAMWPMSSARRPPAGPSRPGRDDLLAQRGGDERRVSGDAGDRRIDHGERRVRGLEGRRRPTVAGRRPPCASQLADGLRPHQRHVGRKQEEPGDAGVQGQHPGADGREHAGGEPGVGDDPGAGPDGYRRHLLAPVPRHHDDVVDAGVGERPTAHSSSVRPSTSTSGLNALMREERPAASTMAASRSTLRRLCRTAPGRSRRRCSRRAQPASPRRSRGRWASGCGRWPRRRGPPRAEPHPCARAWSGWP